MDKPQPSASKRSTSGDRTELPAYLRPTGLSAVELGARRGIGPLSPLGNQVWHGDARPCVSCGQLVRRTQLSCDQCGQDLSPAMLAKMSALSGPWYVLEHVRPFPGVTLHRLIRQVRRGVLTRTTIVRGPTTAHQWRFAAETPGLCRYLGCCWACQADVCETDTTCLRCGGDLETGEYRDRRLAADTSQARSAELDKLSAALSVSPDATPGSRATGPARLGRIPVSWIVVGLVIVVLVAVLLVVQLRSGATESGGSQPGAPGMVTPTPAPEAAPTGQIETPATATEPTPPRPKATGETTPPSATTP
ncbi:MAG TPA: hypothetical protein VM243_01970 [Phycisphaerae bacterium]|nr:hypothetical protein [Phycisphaerae bacterium]